MFIIPCPLSSCGACGLHSLSVHIIPCLEHEVYCLFLQLLNPVCPQSQNPRAGAKPPADDFRDFAGISGGHDQHHIHRLLPEMVRCHNGQMGGRGIAALLKGGRVNDVSGTPAQVRGGSQGKALVAGTPDSQGLPICSQLQGNAQAAAEQVVL